MTKQGSFPLIGSVTAPRHRHSMPEIRICRGVSDAVYLSMRHAAMSQETLAHRIHVTPSYLSMLMSGKRPWQTKHLQRIRTVTGSLATLQYAAMAEGVELYADPIEQQKAQLRAQLAELENVA